MDETISRAEHEEFAKRMESENERQNHRLTNLENEVKEIAALASNIDRLATSMENMAKEQERQGTRLETLESRDGEMWRKVVGYAITVIVGIVLGYMATQIGM